MANIYFIGEVQQIYFSCSVKRRLRAEAGLAVVALRGVRGSLPHHALRQRLPLLGYDLLTLQVNQDYIFS